MASIQLNSSEEDQPPHVAIEIAVIPQPHDPVAVSIAGMLKKLHPLSSECSIYRVPSRLRQINPKAYTPQIVSIGPLHHGSRSLAAMDDYKLRYLERFVSRTEQRINLQEIVAKVRTWEEPARRTYAQPINLDSDGFVKLMLVDGCFVVELLLRFYNNELIDELDPFFGKPRLIYGLCRDLEMLENQLPFFVLDGLFKSFPNSVYGIKDDVTFFELTRFFFRRHMNLGEISDPFLCSEEINHFVHFLRLYFVSQHSSRMPQIDETNPLQCHSFAGELQGNSFAGELQGNSVAGELKCPPSASELHEVGVVFKRSHKKQLLDISFRSKILEMPQLEIGDESEARFRNLMAYEECHLLEQYVTHYVMFLESLIHTEKDVSLLVKAGIISNHMGSHGDVSTLFNSIGREVQAEGAFYFQELSEEIEAYRKRRRNHWMAILKREYLSTPWLVVSISAATLLLLLTVLQTIFAGISTFNVTVPR